jgi:hypothetical protein
MRLPSVRPAVLMLPLLLWAALECWRLARARGALQRLYRDHHIETV